MGQRDTQRGKRTDAGPRAGRIVPLTALIAQALLLTGPALAQDSWLPRPAPLPPSSPPTRMAPEPPPVAQPQPVRPTVPAPPPSPRPTAAAANRQAPGWVVVPTPTPAPVNLSPPAAPPAAARARPAVPAPALQPAAPLPALTVETLKADPPPLPAPMPPRVVAPAAPMPTPPRSPLPSLGTPTAPPRPPLPSLGTPTAPPRPPMPGLDTPTAPPRPPMPGLDTPSAPPLALPADLLRGAGGPPALGPALGDAPAGAVVNRLQPGVRSTLTFTDNGARAPDAEKKRDQVAEITPYLLGRLETPESRGAFSYALRGIARAQQTQPNDLRHDLRAGGDMALGTPSLRLSGTALVLDVNRSPLQQTLDPSLATPSLRLQYRRIELSPYLLGERAGAFEYQLRYRASAGNDLIEGQSSTAQGVTAFVRGLEAPGRLGWDTAGQYNRRSFDNGYAYGYGSFASTVYLPLGIDARFGLAAHYSVVDIVLDDRGRNRGWGPGVAFDWIPSERTSLRAMAARQYYGNTGSIRLIHRAPTWTVGLNAWQQLLTSTDSGLVYLDPARQFATQRTGSNNPIIDELVRLTLVNPTGTVLATAPIGAGMVMDRRLTGMLGLVGSTNAVLFSGFSVTRDMLPLTADAVAGLPALAATGALIDQRGFSMTLTHQVNPLSAFYLRAVLADSRIGASDTYSRLGSVAVGYRTMFRPEVTGVLEARHTQQRMSQGLSGQYDENAVAATVDLRF